MTARARTRVRESAQVWRERVERWKQSGKTVREFAAVEGIRPERLAWWRSRLQREQSACGPEAEVPTLPSVQVRGAEVQPAWSALELVLAGGRVVVRVGADIDELALRRVVAVLGGA